MLPMPHTSPSRTQKAKPGSLGGSVQNCSVDGLFVVHNCSLRSLYFWFFVQDGIVRRELLEGISSLSSHPTAKKGSANAKDQGTVDQVVSSDNQRGIADGYWSHTHFILMIGSTTLRFPLIRHRALSNRSLQPCRPILRAE
jgi:hypothetical protein